MGIRVKATPLLLSDWFMRPDKASPLTMQTPSFRSKDSGQLATSWRNLGYLFAHSKQKPNQSQVSSNTGAINAHVEWEATPVAVLQTCNSLRDALKQAMRRLASSVTIISANEDGAVYGLAATAVTSLALDPPSLIICVNRQATIYEPLLRSGAFCANLLRPEHQALSAAFTGKKAGR